MHRDRGFTLIEVMIVIAIIAILAALAIPGLIQSQRASHERNAASSLKTLATAEADFKGNDRDGNRVNDFWTRDVSGLFTAHPPGTAPNVPVKLIELSVASADAVNLPAIAVTPTSLGTSLISNFMIPQAKAGYWFYALVSDMSPTPNLIYAQSTDITGMPVHNASSFGFGTYADSQNAGRQLFLINEGSFVVKRTCLSSLRPGTATPPGLPVATGVPNGATDPPTTWPADSNLKSNYSKMD